MNRNRPIIGLAVVATLAIGLAYLGWTMLRPSGAGTCHACGRPVHANVLTIGLDDGHREAYCCLACALTHHQQSGDTVGVAELRDYQTGDPVAPQEAYIVRESDVNLCMRHAMLAYREGSSSAMDFDRCAPSMLAFATRERAAEFQRQHGGVLLPFSEVHRAFQTP
jgi:hypothetical protein